MPTPYYLTKLETQTDVKLIRPSDERLVISNEMNMTNPLTLQQQLLARVAQFQKTFPNITQSEIARHCGIGESNFGAALAGRRGLSANSCLQLHTLLSSPRNEVIKKFSQPVRSSKIVNFQSAGQGMRLDNDGWVSGGQSGTDPNGSSTIDTTDDADTSMDTAALATTLRQVRSIHRKAIRAINFWLVSTKVNNGSTPVNNNQSFSGRRILKAIRFAKAEDSADTTSATQDLLDTLGTLDVVTRRKVIGAILQAFPASASLR